VQRSPQSEPQGAQRGSPWPRHRAPPCTRWQQRRGAGAVRRRTLPRFARRPRRGACRGPTRSAPTQAPLGAAASAAPVPLRRRPARPAAVAVAWRCWSPVATVAALVAELAAKAVVAALDRARVLNIARLPIAPRRSADAARRASISPLLELVAEGCDSRMASAVATAQVFGFVSSWLDDSSALVVLPCLDHFLGSRQDGPGRRAGRVGWRVRAAIRRRSGRVLDLDRGHRARGGGSATV